MVGDTKRDRSKLSWVYRNKKKTGKIEKRQNKASVRGDNQRARIVVKNLSFQVTEEDLKQLYEPFGQLEEINILKRPDGKPVGCAFVEFKKLEDASKAIFKTNKQEFLGRLVTSTWAISKSRYMQKVQEDKQSSGGDNQSEALENKNNEKNPDISSDTKIVEDETSEKPKKLKVKLTAEERKALKLRKKLKRARIIVRNLSFQATDNHLKDHFSQYGDIIEIKVLTKSDGKRTGCAFVQFNQVQSAAKAIHYSNMKVICDRSIVVDWAVPKEKFDQNINVNEIKKESEDPEEIEIKEEKEDEEIEDFNYEEREEKNEEDEEESDTSDDSGDDDESDNSDDDFKNEDDVKDESIIKEKEEEKRPRVISHDVREGKTIFLKNVPFSAKNEHIKTCMERFGPVHYALVCIDPLTEHSKGTGFVKFKNLEDAEKCITAEPDLLRLHDQILEPHHALDRNEVFNKNTSSSRRIKDSRNLYLVKEGVIVVGTPAAVGVSATDMKKRLQLEQWKSQMLKNLNMFVSRNRLVVQNLPDSVDDVMLRKIFKKYSGPKAIVQEARVMKDIKTIDAKGVGKSKGFGFVSFTTHEDALKALRNINNNPKIFSKSMRPIVAFSIENRIIVNVKQRRIEKSRENNPLWKNKQDGNNINDSKESREPPKKRFKKNLEGKINRDTEVPQYSGLTSKPGQSGKLRSRFKLKTQALLHDQIRKQEKRENKNEKNMIVRKNNQILSKREQMPKQKKNKVNTDDVNFNKLVNKYKHKLETIPRTKSKWYET